MMEPRLASCFTKDSRGRYFAISEIESLHASFQIFIELALLFFSRVHATLQPALSVGRLVGWSVGWSHFTFFINFISLSHF